MTAKYLAVMTVFVFLLMVPMTYAGELLTVHKIWESIPGRSAIAVADPNIPNVVDPIFGPTNRKWADRPTAKLFRASENENHIVFHFVFSNASAECNYEVWAYADDGDAEPICIGTATAGGQTASIGGYYAGKITCASRSVLTWQSTDIVGHDEMAMLWGDGLGRRYWYVRISTITAGSVTIRKRAF